MALPIFQVDYSPIYSAFNSLRGAKTTQLAEKHRKQDVGTATLGFVLEGGEMIVEMIVAAVAGAKLAAAKADVMAFDQAAQQKAKDAIFNNDYEIVSQEPRDIGIEEGAKLEGKPYRSLKLGGDFENWYSTRQQEIEDKYKGFPKIKSWAFDQMYASYDTAKRVATDTLFNKAMQDTARIDQQSITHSVDQAIRFERFDLVDAALAGTQSLTPDIKDAMRGDLLKQYDLGIQNKRLRETVGGQGYAAGMNLISGWEAAGEVNAEQAENFRKMALGAAGQVASTFQDQATIQFYEQITGGKDPEAAMQSLLQAVPMPYRGQTEKMVRADYNERLRIEDEKADKEMLIVNNENPQDGAALLRALYNQKNNYAGRMDTSTYTFWENYGNRLMASAGAGGEDDGTTQAGVQVLNEIIREPWRTKPQKIKAVQNAGQLRDPKTGDFLIGPTVLNKYLNYANSDVYYKPEVNAAWDRINKFFDKLEAKNDTDMTRTRQQVLEEFSTEVSTAYQATKPPKATDIEDIADRVLSPHKSAILPSDQAGNLSRRTRAAQLLQRSGEISLNPEEKAELESYQRTALQELYGVGTGTIQIAGVSKDERGRPIFSITGLNPQDVRTPYTYRFGLDPKGNLQLEGEDSTGHFIPVPIKTTEQISRENLELKRKETRAKGEEIRRAAAAVRTIADVKREAERLGTTPERLGMAAIGAELGTSPGEALMRLETLLLRQFRARQATAEDVRQAAKKTGISEAAAYGLLLNQGIRILE